MFSLKWATDEIPGKVKFQGDLLKKHERLVLIAKY
jgi:hypothetical protein